MSALQSMRSPVDGSPIVRGAFCAEDRPYQMCIRCVMDTTDPAISFGDDGVCSHCHYFDSVVLPNWPKGEEAKDLLDLNLREIKTGGTESPYDCIIGVSGGVDSSFLVVKAVEWGLRPLVVHVDAGWNSELAVKNIETLCRHLNVELHTVVVPWPAVRVMQVAFLHSHVANQDIPQDHAFFAALYRFAEQEKVRTVLNGSNFATESVLPESWGYNAMDSKHIRDIFKRCGTGKFPEFPTVSPFEFYFRRPYLKRQRIIKPLNWINYSKLEAVEYLEGLGWSYYGGKHYESRWTRFFQSYYLPYKFGYDKRKAHLSSLVLSGEMSRDGALSELSKPLIDAAQLSEDVQFVERKLGLRPGEIRELADGPVIDYREYANSETMLRLGLRALRLLRKLR